MKSLTVRTMLLAAGAVFHLGSIRPTHAQMAPVGTTNELVLVQARPPDSGPVAQPPPESDWSIRAAIKLVEGSADSATAPPPASPPLPTMNEPEGELVLEELREWPVAGGFAMFRFDSQAPDESYICERRQPALSFRLRINELLTRPSAFSICETFCNQLIGSLKTVAMEPSAQQLLSSIESVENTAVVADEMFQHYRFWFDLFPSSMRDNLVAGFRSALEDLPLSITDPRAFDKVNTAITELEGKLTQASASAQATAAMAVIGGAPVSGATSSETPIRR